MSEWRFAVWSAVSSEEQALDKDSLANQLKICREYGSRLGGIETAGPFIADGYSRTGYVDLSEAMVDIPPLADAIKAAERNEYDVLFARYFDRFGDVANNVFIKFKRLRKQLRSVQESTPIFPPSLYEPSKDDATATMIHVGGIKQDARINRLINNLKENMPKRVRDGLSVAHAVYGYKYINARTPHELIPEAAARIIHARDMLMSGESYYHIADYLGVSRNTAKNILGNPYYAGIINWGMSSIRPEGTVKHKRIYHSKSNWTTGVGKHEHIFTLAEHESILAEMQRRRETTKGATIQHVLSGLLRCDICDGSLRQVQQGWDKNNRQLMIVCRPGGNTHVAYKYDEFMTLVKEKIKSELSRHEEETPEQLEDKSAILKKALENNKRLRAKIQEGFETGLYSVPEASRRLRDLETSAEQTAKDLEKMSRTSTEHRDAEEVMVQLQQINIDVLMGQGDVGRVNRLLSAWLREIRVQNGGVIKLVRR